MWAVQSVIEPPQTVLAMQHGQVVITGRDVRRSPAEPDSQVVGHAKTVELCRPESGRVDSWLTHDPWSKAVGMMPSLPPAAPAPQVLHELEQRLEQSILSKLPAPDHMEVDGQDQRLQLLEQQVQQLASRQTF